MSAASGSVLTIHAYSQALYNAARAQGVVQRLIEESKMIVALLTQKPTFAHFLEGPQISREKKRVLVDQAFRNRVNPLMLNLLYMMVDRERALLLRAILERFQEIAEQAEGIFPATIFSARDLGFQEKLKLKTALEKYTRCHLRIRYQVQPPLLGGIVFRFRDVLIDGSVRYGLRQLRRLFKHEEGIAA